jgi:hypothetical protein
MGDIIYSFRLTSSPIKCGVVPGPPSRGYRSGIFRLGNNSSKLSTAHALTTVVFWAAGCQHQRREVFEGGWSFC